MTAALPGITIHIGDCERDAVTAAAIIAASFVDLRASAWLVPDPAERGPVLRAVFTITAQHALDHGVLHLLRRPGDSAAVEAFAAAVWVDRTHPIPDPHDYQDRLHAAAGSHIERFRHLDDLFDAHHPLGGHHHLALLGVVPTAQSTGIGTLLLTHHHARLDAERVPAYLEAAGPNSRRLYERHGYERSGEEFTLANGAAFTPMWRHPRPGDPT